MQMELLLVKHSLTVLYQEKIELVMLLNCQQLQEIDLLLNDGLSTLMQKVVVM
jgi:hypothetical protein